MATLHEAFDQLKSDPNLAKKFTEDPKGTLNQLGVDTSKVHIAETAGGQGVQPPPKVKTIDSITTCGSIGVVGCVSVGS